MLFPFRILFASIVLVACSGEPNVVRPVEASAAKTIQAFVVSHGWHTGLIIPGERLNQQIPDLASRFGTPRFYEIGWGDKGFYEAPEITAGLALRAMFWSSGAVLHVATVPVSPKDSFPESEILPICVSPSELAALNQFVSASFSHEASGGVVPRAKGIYGESQFYDAVGRYSMLNTCNTWTAKGLSSAGFDLRPGMKLTAEGVMRYLRDATPGTLCAAGAP